MLAVKKYSFISNFLAVLQYEQSFKLIVLDKIVQKIVNSTDAYAVSIELVQSVVSQQKHKESRLNIGFDYLWFGKIYQARQPEECPWFCCQNEEKGFSRGI